MRLLVSLVLALALSGCDSDRLAKLEKQNAALGAQLTALQKTNQLEAQSKCAKDTRDWFARAFESDKDTTLLEYTNHYNISRNKCFASVNWNYHLGNTNSFNKLIFVYDVYENARVGEYSEYHLYIVDHFRVSQLTCSVYAVKCSSYDDYAKAIRPLMNE
jgi:hypothetical protein